VGKSYYESTRRVQVDDKAKLATQQSYNYNYSSMLPESCNANILDIGCSEGVSLEWFVSNGYLNVTGIDTDEFAIQFAQERLRGKLDGSQIICADAFSYLKKCDDDSLDMIVMFNVIEHIPVDVIVQLVPEIYRVLRKEGVFFAQTGNWENPFNIGLFTRDITHRVMYTKNSLRQLLLMSGFSVNKIKLSPVRYKTTLRNFPLQISSPIAGFIVKMIAMSMRIHINETSPLIYSVAKK